MVLQKFSIHSPSGAAILVVDPSASKAYFQKRMCIWFCNSFSSTRQVVLFQFSIHLPEALQSVQHSNNCNKAYILGQMCIWLARVVLLISIHLPEALQSVQHSNNSNKAYIWGRIHIWLARVVQKVFLCIHQVAMLSYFCIYLLGALLSQFCIYLLGAVQSVQHCNTTNKAYILKEMRIWLAMVFIKKKLYTLFILQRYNKAKGYLGLLVEWKP